VASAQPNLRPAAVTLQEPRAFLDHVGHEEWAALVAAASEPNAFLEPWFLTASLTHLVPPTSLRLAVFRGPDGALAGLMPLSIETHYGRLPLRHVQNHLHHNIFLGTPLVRRGFEQYFWSELLAALDASDWAQGLLCITDMTEDGALHCGLKDATRALGKDCDTVLKTRRALLASDLASTDYYEAAVRKKKRKEIKRLQNRLEELGKISFETLTTPELADPWCAEFLALEQAGWKAESGSPLASNAATQAFFKALVRNGLAAKRVEILKLSLDAHPLAMLINFMAAPGSFSFKIAYDEAYARFSPGVLLQLENLKILDRAGFDWMDSCASEDHPMINSLWMERRSLVWVAIPLRGFKREMLFRLTRFAENSWAALKALRARPANDNRDRTGD
jgi:CelD/BcsL family acetyltransferase involved in cellulose biosynthesis